VRLEDYGLFVSLLPGKDGLVHISQIAEERIENVHDHFSMGQEVDAKVLDIDRQGRIKLTMRGLDGSGSEGQQQEEQPVQYEQDAAVCHVHTDACHHHEQPEMQKEEHI
jgi:predicted RNA-binding protein with RPS1 domain